MAASGKRMMPEGLGMKRVLTAFCFCAIILIPVLLQGCSKPVELNSMEKRNIALIAKMNSGYHWGAIKQGADTAAREFNINIDFNAPDDEEDVEGQIKLVNQAIDKKVDALILAASDYNALVKVTERAFDLHIPVVIIDSEVNTKKINSYIATDNYNAGKKAGNALADLVGKSCNVAIMNFVKGSKNAEQREEGLLSFISQYPGIKVTEKAYCSSDTNLAYQLTRKIISEHPEVNAIVAFNAISSEGVAEAVDQAGLSGRIKIVSFDSTPKEIDYMEKEVIQATITQNPFSMGYLGVKYAVDLLNKKNVPVYTDTGSKIITRENMYLPENQKLLFPIVK